MIYIRHDPPVPRVALSPLKLPFGFGGAFGGHARPDPVEHLPVEAECVDL